MMKYCFCVYSSSLLPAQFQMILRKGEIFGAIYSRHCSRICKPWTNTMIWPQGCPLTSRSTVVHTGTRTVIAVLDQIRRFYASRVNARRNRSNLSTISCLPNPFETVTVKWKIGFVDIVHFCIFRFRKTVIINARIFFLFLF
jgi:hypothetical protein